VWYPLALGRISDLGDWVYVRERARERERERETDREGEGGEIHTTMHNSVLLLTIGSTNCHALRHVSNTNMSL